MSPERSVKDVSGSYIVLWSRGATNGITSDRPEKRSIVPLTVNDGPSGFPNKDYTHRMPKEVFILRSRF